MVRFCRYAVCLLILSAQFSFGQSINLSLSDNLTKADSNIVSDEPAFNFGLETVLGATFDKNIKYNPGVFGYVDVNLSQGVYFLKSEAGTIANFASDDKLAFYASTGFSINLFRPNINNLIYFHSAFLTVINKTGGGFSFLLSMRYLHRFNKMLGLVTSIRYIIGSNAMLVTLGIQF